LLSAPLNYEGWAGSKKDETLTNKEMLLRQQIIDI